MNITPHQLATVVIICGAYLIIIGLTARTLITESDIPATEHEKAAARATPTGRLICVAIGLGGCIYGIFLLLR
jgi:hypothetical protein